MRTNRTASIARLFRRTKSERVSELRPLALLYASRMVGELAAVTLFVEIGVCAMERQTQNSIGVHQKIIEEMSRPVGAMLVAITRIDAAQKMPDGWLLIGP